MHATATFSGVAGYGRPLGNHVGSTLAALMTPPVMMPCSPHRGVRRSDPEARRTVVARAPHAGGGRKVLGLLPAEAREGDVDDNHPPDRVLADERGQVTAPPPSLLPSLGHIAAGLRRAMRNDLIHVTPGL